MSRQPPYGNLTAVLVVVALLELVIDRLLGRLFLSPGCHSGFGCLLLRTGPYLLYLTGVLILVIACGGVLGHLRRGELFPRGMRLTIGVLSAVFLLLIALSLLLGRIPDRYHVHLETSFGFVVALSILSFVGSTMASGRARIGFILFALPPLIHIVALVAARGGWLSHGSFGPERLTALGEKILLAGALASPVLIVPPQVPSSRLGSGLALGAGMSAFFFVALLGRTDLVQTVALYTVQLEPPRALSLLGVWYVLALFGFVTSTAVLLMSEGPARLCGLGMCLLGTAGYQTSSPIALGLSFCGLMALATGLVRTGTSSGRVPPPISEEAWRSLLAGLAAALSDTEGFGADVVLTEPGTEESSSGEGDVDSSTIKARRRGHDVVVKVYRARSAQRRLEVTVGLPGEGPVDTTIEPHESWMGRRPEERGSLPRVKTGDLAFDRKLGVHGRSAPHEAGLRRRILRLSDGTIGLWSGRAARFVTPGNPTQTLRRFNLLAGQTAIRAVVEAVDALIDLVEASSEPAPSGAA